jgi:hypothetical protein
MYTKTWFKDLLERCIKTAVQVFLATMVASGTDLISGFSDVDALEAAGLAALGAVASILFSVVSAWASSSNGTASLVPEVVAAEPPPPPHGA